MAQYVLAGIAQCPQFARAEILADDLSINLPDFSVHKIVLSEKEWDAWLKETCSKHGWKHGSSPLVWRELVDRGGAGTYLGGWDDFRKMAEHWYSFGDKLDSTKISDISSENKATYEKDKAASIKPPVTPVKVAVLGATQTLSYNLLPLLFNSCFKTGPLAIILQDIEDHAQQMEGIKMEIDDCSFPELHSVTTTHSVSVAAAGADFLLILDPLDSSSHPDRFQLLKAANLLYKGIAEDLKNSLKSDSKIVINGYKGCLGGMLLRHYGVTSTNISVVVNLDEQRMRSKLAKRLAVLPSDIQDITVWGNVPVHNIAVTALASVHNHEGAITGPASYAKTVGQAVNEDKWEVSHISTRDVRDKAVMDKSGNRPDMASALAVFRHISTLVTGSENATMGCLSAGQYGTTAGAVFGFPVSVTEGVVSVREVGDLPEHLKELVQLQDSQLQVEKQVALGECDDVETSLIALEGMLWKILETPKLKRELEEKEAARIAAEEAERKAAEARAKEEAKRKAEEEAQRLAEEEAAAAAAAMEEMEEDEADEDEEEEEEE